MGYLSMLIALVIVAYLAMTQMGMLKGRTESPKEMQEAASAAGVRTENTHDMLGDVRAKVAAADKQEKSNARDAQAVE